MKKIKPDEFKLLCQYIYEISGIHLDASKTYLVETRLNTLLDRYECNSYTMLYSKARSDVSKAVERDIIAAISTNETLFFRDSSPFDLLAHKILPDLIDQKSAKRIGSLPMKIRIWSAACSSGQEIYSIAITLQELLKDLRKYDIQLLGTDISDEMVKKASYGLYNQFEIDRGLPKDKLRKYFSPVGTGWRIRDEIRVMASFRRHNLMLPFMGLGKFDVIFCRNVAIYFNMADRIKVFDKMAESLDPNGYFIIGSSESLTGVSQKFVPKRYLKSIYYQLKQ